MLWWWESICWPGSVIVKIFLCIDIKTLITQAYTMPLNWKKCAMTGYEQISLYFKQTHIEKANEYLVTRGGLSQSGNQGVPPFYFPDREKNVKIFPVWEIKWSFLYTSAYCPADKYVLTDGKDECTGQILNELSRISPIEFLKKWTVFEKYIFKVGSFLAQLGIFTTFPFWTAYFPNRKIVIILYLQVLVNKQVRSIIWSISF